MDEDLEQLLLGFDAIRSAQAVPPRWSAEWDERLKRGHEVRGVVWCGVVWLFCVCSQPPPANHRRSCPARGSSVHAMSTPPFPLPLSRASRLVSCLVLVS